MAKEILSIQCGHLSNLIGAHWWNIQQAECHSQEIQHACMFSEEVNAATGIHTYTPRLLLIDSSGNGRCGGYHSDEDTTPAWDGTVEKHPLEPKKGLKKCKLDCDIDAGAWSSVLHVPLSRRSRLIIPESSVSTAVDFYPFGLQVWEEKKFQSNVEDTLRYFAEECDSIQGFHLLSDWSTGFGALATCIAELIVDEYASKSIISFPVSSASCADNNVAAVNTCFALDGMVSNTSLVCPMSSSTEAVHPWYSIAGENPRVQSYEASAVVAAGVLDTITLFYRCVSPLSCASVCAAAGAYGRKLGVLNASLPLPVNLETPLSSMWKQHGGLHALLHPLTPFFPNGEEDILWSDMLSLRGVAPNQPLWPSTDPRFAFHPRLVDLLAEELAAGPQRHDHYQWSTSVVEQPLLLYPPSTEPSPPANVCSPERLLQLPVCASLQSRSGAGQVVAHLHDKLAHVKLRTMPVFTASAHLEEDSFIELSHRLNALYECYRTSGCSED
ncbi:hypothetical protein EMCRGX_G022365 [Ephydatia muelleri]